MPLPDHFHPPLSLQRHWHSFHNTWAAHIADDLNRKLPPGFFAESNVQFGIEIDVADFEEGLGSEPTTAGWTPPAPSLSVPVMLAAETVEILVYRNEGGPVLAGAVELVSPGNQDRPSDRDNFVSKCASFLNQGIGLALVDMVTSRKANLHAQLLERFAAAKGNRVPDLYATAYRLVERKEQTILDVWQEPLGLGQPLPTLPFWLRGEICVPLDLEGTYEFTAESQRFADTG